MRYAHTNIISKDWKQLAEFYIEVFDCELLPPVRKLSGDWLSKGTGVKDSAFEGAHLLLPGHGEHGPTLEIFQYTEIIGQEPVLPNQRGFGHLAFEVDNVEVMLEKLLANGGTNFGGITTKVVEGVGELTFVYARDPEGNLVELQHWER
ncbi:MAG: VOC family protein [Phaeodactylibacter sp.]|nr:VOC family protein [Phaeodactylibacter sp.]